MRLHSHLPCPLIAFYLLPALSPSFLFDGKEHHIPMLQTLNLLFRHACVYNPISSSKPFQLLGIRKKQNKKQKLGACVLWIPRGYLSFTSGRDASGPCCSCTCPTFSSSFLPKTLLGKFLEFTLSFRNYPRNIPHKKDVPDRISLFRFLFVSLFYFPSFTTNLTLLVFLHQYWQFSILNDGP